MSDPFVAEIRMFAGNFAPTGWATCDGQLLPISQNTALFSLLGTFYGGNGQSTFALPNLQDSTPNHQGQGAGLQEYFLGQQGGSDTITLLTTEIPLHNHNVQWYSQDPADSRIPNPNESLAAQGTGLGYNPLATGLQLMAFQAFNPAGGSLPHNNIMPYLTVTFIIAMQGVFPPRT